MLRRSLSLAALAALPLLVAGCGGSGTHRVYGKVSFNGQPVPAGKVYIIPDSAKGNKGPTGYADIRNGVYDTSSSGGRGAASGAVIIAVEGIDPSAPPPAGEPDVTAKLLFPRYETAAEVSGSLVKDIAVPAEAAKGPIGVKPPGPAIIP